MYNRSEGVPNRPFFGHNNDDMMNPNLNEEEEEVLDYYRNDSQMDPLERGSDLSLHLQIDFNCILNVSQTYIVCGRDGERGRRHNTGEPSYKCCQTI